MNIFDLKLHFLDNEHILIEYKLTQSIGEQFYDNPTILRGCNFKCKTKVYYEFDADPHYFGGLRGHS